MNKILDRLIVNRNDKTRHNYDGILVKTLDEIIDVLEDFEKQITELGEKIKKLKQAQTYFPMEYHETNETGGVDNIKIYPYIDKVANTDLIKKGDD